MLSHLIADRYGADVASAYPGIDIAHPPADDADPPFDEATLARIDYAFFSLDIYPESSRSFFRTVRAAPNLKWIHVMSAGVDNVVFQELLKRGIRMTTSSGSTAKPIAQSVIGGMLMLSPRLPHLGRTRSAATRGNPSAVRAPRRTSSARR